MPMAPREFVKVASYANPAEAEQMRGIMEENGIRAFVDGASLNTALSYIGNALGGVGLIVPSRDAERATQLIHEIQEAAQHDHGGAWYCGACEEEVDAGFDVCWKCGASRREVEAPFPLAADIAPEPISLDTTDPGNARLQGQPGLDETNPFASPNAKRSLDASAADRLAIDSEAEAMLNRAWKAAIVGFFIPLIANVYSMYLLLAASQRTNDFSPEGNSRFYWAFALNLLAGMLWGSFMMGTYLPMFR